MKLYYSKAACSLAAHIVLDELGIDYELVSVDLRGEIPADFLAANPLGAVPTLILDDGQSVTEVSVVLQYLADLKPELKLAPRPDSFERYRLEEWLNFIATELHKGFSPLWKLPVYGDEATQAAVKNHVLSELSDRFDIVAQKLGSREFLMPSGYTIADAYMFTILSWHKFLKVDLSKWPTLLQYLERVQARPAVLKAMKSERLIMGPQA